MKKFLLSLSLILCCSVFSKIYASHVMGADLTFACLGPNTYRITLQVYRDCNGIQLNGPLTVNYSSAQCGVNSSLTLNQVGPPTDITPVCFAGTDACNGGSGYGIQKYVFQGTLTLPAGCGSDWVLSWQLCCRNAAITTLSNPGSENLYIEAHLNNTLPTCDSSPTFSNDPIGIYCVNFPQLFNHGATDANGDSLYFYLMPSLNGAGSIVGYNSGYGALNPLATVSGTGINSSTGQLGFTPSQTQVAVMKVGVDEYRNGVLIGHIERDMQLIVTNCNNSAPTAGGVNGTTGPNATTYTTTACSNFCFTIQTSDANTTDSVFYTWINNNLPGATISSSGGLKPLLTVCWAPTQADVGTHNFVINLRNNDCPFFGTAAIAYTVIVNGASDPPVNAGPDVHLCPGTSTTLTATSAGTVTSYNWSDGTNTHTGASWTVNPAVTTIYTVTAVYSNGCQLTDQVIVYRDIPPTVTAFPILTTLCSTTDTVQLSGFSNDPTATYQWSPAAGLTCTTCTNPKASPTATTTYTVVAKDSAGCPSAPFSVTVALAPPPPSQSCSVIYASPTGNGNGTQNNPASLQGAIDSAACNNALIKLAIGFYTIDNPITNITSYTTIEGGFDPANDWRKTSTPGATIIHRSTLNMEGAGTNNARLVAIYMNGNTYFRFQDVTIETANCPALAATDSFGYSSYVLHFTNCSNYNLVRCQIKPGTATGGKAGGTATGTTPTGGTGGAGGAGAGTGCSQNGTAGTAGTAASSGAGGGAAGGGASGSSCNTAGCGVNASSGSNGTAGTAGTAGVSAPAAAPAAPGTNTTFFNVAGQSASGTSGSAGGGGGGGGGGQLGTDCTCSINGTPNGGAGGNGGSGGLAGLGGYGGGGSFGIYLFNNGAGSTIVDCDIIANTAGTGGAGGAGQAASAAGLGSPGVSSSGSCSPQGVGGNGGNGGAGGSGGNGQPGAPGVSAEIISNGTAPTYTSHGANTAITTGINNPAIFNLAAQTTIFAANISCTNRNDTLSSAASGTWTAGTGATVPTGTGVQLVTQYTTTGRKDIGYNGSTYTGFVNIAIDQSSFIPVIQSSAPVLHTDTFWVCKGSTASFNLQIASADTFDWNFGGATVPNTYTGHNDQNLTNLTFNTAGTFMIIGRIKTSCCGWSPYDTAYLVVEPHATLAYTGTTSFCAGDSAHILLSGTGTSYLWSPTAGLSSSTSANVYAFPQATTTYLVTSYSPRGLCNADTSITITKDTPAVVTFTIVPASCGNNGSATANPNPAGAYTYLWNPTGATTATISNQPSGTYSVTVTPAGSNCSTTAATSIGANGGIQAYFAKTISPLCNAACTGQLRVEAIGGSSPYTYHWNSSASTLDSLNNLCAGTYSVTITDHNGCTASATQILSQPLPLSVAVLDSVSPLCGGQCTGSAKVDGQGGTGPYNFVWSAPSTSDSSHAINLCVGPYSITVTDNNGCTAVGGVTITSPPAMIEDTISTKNVSCNGANDGSIIIGVSGGKHPYTFVWPQALTITDSIASPIAADRYTPIVTDSNGCKDTISVTITQPNVLVSAVVFDSIACFGLTADTAWGSATGGTIPYSYQLDGAGAFQASGMFTAMSVGAHSITVKDANGCTSSIPFSIFEPTAISSSILSTTNILCNSQCTGIIATAGAGGTPPYQYSINGGAWSASGTFDSLCANPSYTINVQDKNGCAAAALNDAITQPTAIVLTFNGAVAPVCNNGTNGSFSVSASGGTPGGGTAYTYSADGGPFLANNGSFSPEAAGNHLVTVMDGNGCTDTLTVIVPNPPASSTFDTVVTSVTCPGGSDGTITLTINGTLTPYTFAWSPGGATTQNLTNLSAGLYVVTITDGNGCRVFGPDSIPVTQPNPISAVNTMVPVSCFGGSDGSITVTPSGGTPGYTNSWSNGSTSNNPTGLSGGSYSDTITDAHGCQYVDANIIVTQPNAVAVMLDSVVAVSCIGYSNGAIYLSDSGGTPGYTYAWSPSGSTNPLTGIPVGSYTVTVSDSHNCTATTTVTVGIDSPLSFNAVKKNVFCPPLQNGQISLTVTGGSPGYQYQWSNGAIGSQISGLGVGIDSVTVTDSRGCQIDTGFVISNDSSFRITPIPADTATINEGDAIQLGIQVHTSGGDRLANINWTPAYELSCTDCVAPLATPINTTQYYITAVSDSGCTANTQILITVIPQHQLYIPNAFTPNGSGVNDYWEVFGNKKVWKFMEVEVFDRWGEKIFQSNDLNFQWDGRYRGTLMEPGVYVYVFKVTFIDGYTVSNKGTITLIR